MTTRSRLALLALALPALAGCSSSGPIDAGTPSAAGPFDKALVARGARLAAVGNCISCHTAADGRAYAGGYPLHTPFGTVYGTNITPDPETGIGRWSEAAFVRAMREGIDREGHQLYPAFPYEYFTRLSDEDLHALYAFVMTREPVRAATPPNRMLVPRPAVALWKARYFKPERFRADPSRPAMWNRGAYLTESLAHCSACHTPRNALGAEKKEAYLSGGEAGAWHAPALDASSPSPVPWTATALATYLRTGLVDEHAISAGPMRPVVTNLSRVPEEDARAIAEYIVSIDTRSVREREARARAALAAPVSRAPATADDRAVRNGAALYAGACGDCHDRGRAAEGGALPLPLAIGLTIPTPRNLIHIVRDGIVPGAHEAHPWMPEFRGALTDAELADLVAYLRSLTDKPPWHDVEAEMKRASKGEG
jgi:mono/diheme cytochrome c family protein